MTLTLKDIWGSSTGLLQRFSLMPTVDTAWTKHMEEVGELIEALYILNLKEHRKHFNFRKDVAQEACDVLVTLFNALYAAGLTFDQSGLRTHQLRDVWLTSNAGHEAMRPAVFEFLSAGAIFHKHLIETQCLTGDSLLDAQFDLSKQTLILVRALINLTKQGGITLDEFEAAIECVVFKNGNKSDKTHVVIDGFIKRIQPVPTVVVEGE